MNYDHFRRTVHNAAVIKTTRVHWRMCSQQKFESMLSVQISGLLLPFVTLAFIDRL